MALNWVEFDFTEILATTNVRSIKIFNRDWRESLGHSLSRDTGFNCTYYLCENRSELGKTALKQISDVSE